MLRTAPGLIAALALAGAAHAQVTPPPITARPAHPGNYTAASRTFVNMIVIHKGEGTNASGYFASSAASASAHYDVHFDGSVYRSVADDDVAWHSGNSAINARSIGIEHSGFSALGDTTEAEYRASARLVAWLCQRHRIPVDRQHIIGHAEVPHPSIPGRFGGASGHWDPGPRWEWDYFMALVRAYLGTRAVPAPPPGLSAGAQPVLREGARGKEVVRLQDLLGARGFDPGARDGTFGPRTAAAVRAFQGARGLPVDGVVAASTWALLLFPPGPGPAPPPPVTPPPSPPPPTTPPPPPPAARPTLRLGSRGPEVVRLQDLLRSRGFPPGPSDGVFGSQTDAAVRRFQAARGLGVDGVVGPGTWGALTSAPPPRPPSPPLPSGTVLRQGDRGPAVVALQDALRRRGFDPGPSDGIFGPGTAGAVRAFQAARGLAVDGVVGPRTWDALR